MSVRRETIILELEDNASREALQAATAFKTLDHSIDSMSGHATTVNRRFTSMSKRADTLAASMGKANKAIGATDAHLDSLGSRGLVRFSGQADRASASIDTFSGRLGLLGTAAMALGPALIPIGAVGIPAIATLTAGMGAAAGAAGVMVLAFQGIGAAVTAVSDYRLEPTAENLAKVREEMEKLGPAGADFVMAIDRAMPAFRELQMTAREGMFPGLERGLDTLVTQLPGVRDLVAGLSETVGTLGEATADALVNDSDWQEFFAHIGTDGASALEDFGRATGNFTAGVANLLEAMTGIGGGSAGMLETSRAFREWADNLEHAEGFKEFADYIRESGPAVADFLSSTGKAMLALVEAAAPWGQAVLPALTALADVSAVIAGSPLGPPLFAAAAAMLVFNKAADANAAIMGRVAPSIAGTRASMGQLRDDLKTVTSGWVLASSAAEAESKKYAAAQGRLKALAGEAARTGPALAAMGLMATGASEKMGLTNTAVLALAGSMAGPWGTAIGAGVGLTMDLAAANDNLTEAIENANAAMKSGGLQELTTQAKVLQSTLTEATDSDVFGFDVFGAGFVNAIAPLSNLEKLMGGLTGETDKAAKALEKIKAQKAGMEDLAVALGANRDSSEEMASGADRAKMAMEKLGISNKEMTAAQQEGGQAWDRMQGQIAAYVAQADTAAGRTAAFGDALENMGNDALSAAANAATLASTFSAIVDPAQGLIAAQDGMTSTLHDLEGQLSKTNKTLVGNSDAAIQNRAAISAGVDGIQNLNAAQAEAGVSTTKMALTLNQQRQALIDSGVAAGLSRGQVERLVNQMGLTPAVVRTAFEAAGIDGVTAKTQGLINRFRTLPPKVQTKIQADGIPSTMGQVDALVKKYNLTEKQRRALITLMDNATPGLNRIIGLLGRVRGKTVQVKVDSGQAISNVAAVQASINALSGKTVTVTTLQKTIYMAGKQAAIAQGRADGGEVLGQRYPYGDKVLVALAPGEEVITNRNGQADRFRRDRELGLIPAYAQGGTIGDYPGYAKGGKVRGVSVKASGDRDKDIAKTWDRAAKTTARALAAHGEQLDRATDRLDYWNNKRGELKSQVVGSLTRDWMGDGSTNIWGAGAAEGTAAYAQQQWKQQIKDSKALSGNIANLRKNGAGDAFLAEILRSDDPLAAARMFNKQSVGGMRHSQKLFLEASRRAQGAGTFGSNVVFGDEIAKTTREVRGVRKDIKSLTKLQKLQHKQAQDSRKKNGAGKATSSGSRARTRSKKG